MEKIIVKETDNPIDNVVVQGPGNSLPAPKGIGMAVAFDWGLAAQILATPLLPLFVPGAASALRRTGQSALISSPLSILVMVLFAALLITFGEGVRRGWSWTRIVQIVFNTLGFLGGFFSLFNFIQASQHGNYWPLVTTVILLIFSPLIAWRMSRRETGQWFKQVTSTQARKRHGGMWPVYIALWAIVGGILQALAVFAR
jgi:hypothetical protein